MGVQAAGKGQKQNPAPPIPSAMHVASIHTCCLTISSCIVHYLYQCLSRFSREMESIGYVYIIIICIYDLCIHSLLHTIYHKELAHLTMKMKKSQDLQLASCGLRRADASVQAVRPTKFLLTWAFCSIQAFDG